MSSFDDIPADRARCFSIKDHNDEDVRLVWIPKPAYDQYTGRFPPFPFQIYVLNCARATIQDSGFPRKFVEWIDRSVGPHISTIHYHFQVYASTLDNVPACIDHQRKEIRHRNRNGIWPRLIGDWDIELRVGYKGMILVIDDDDWMTHGPNFVKFDRPQVDRINDSIAVRERLVKGGLVAQAQKYRHAGLSGHLRNAWTLAGQIWTQQDLARRNEGGHSPALYPAVDPTAHEDVDFEDIEDHTASIEADPYLPQDILQDVVTTDDGFPPAIVKQLDKMIDKQLRIPAKALSHLAFNMYEDLVGWQTEAIWDTRQSKTRPSTSFVIYLAAGNHRIAGRALFNCLNQGLLKQAQWTLDVVRNVPSIESAYYHYSREFPRRSSRRTAERRKCMGMLVERIAGRVLPKELLESIAELLQPPAYPTQFYLSTQRSAELFLFLDPRNQETAPQIFYPFCTKGQIVPDLPCDPQAVTGDPWYNFAQIELLFWHLVSDELHTLWSLFSPRHFLPGAKLPVISLSISVPETCFVDQYYTYDFAPEVVVSVTLHYFQPITLHLEPLFALGAFNPAPYLDGIYDVTDLSTNVSSPMTASRFPRLEDQQRYSWTWRESHTLNPPLETLYPGKKQTWKAIAPEGRPWFWWRTRYYEGRFVPGHEYRLRLREGLTVPRWTLGEVGDLKGPYNLPPLSVVGENEARFRIELLED